MFCVISLTTDRNPVRTKVEKYDKCYLISQLFVQQVQTIITNMYEVCAVKSEHKTTEPRPHKSSKVQMYVSQTCLIPDNYLSSLSMPVNKVNRQLTLITNRMKLMQMTTTQTWCNASSVTVPHTSLSATSTLHTPSRLHA